MRKSFLPRLASGSLDNLGRLLLRTPRPLKENSIPTPEPKISSARSRVTDDQRIAPPKAWGKPWSDPGSRMVVQGAARLLFNENIGWRPPQSHLRAEDVVNLGDYSAAIGWQDLGATKTGVTQNENNLFVALAEMTLERIDFLFRWERVVQLAILWMRDGDGLRVAHYPLVVYRGHRHDPTSGEAQIPTVFEIIEPTDTHHFQVFQNAAPPSPVERLYATVSA